MLRMATRNSWKYPIWAAGLLVIQGLGSWHYGVLAGVLTVVCGAIVVLSKQRYPRWILDEGLAPGLLKRIAVFVGILLPLVGFLFMQVQATVEGDAAVYQRGLSIFPDGIPQPELIERQLKDPFINPENLRPAENIAVFCGPHFTNLCGFACGSAKH